MDYRLEHFAEVDSTNLVVKRAVDAGEAEGFAAQADVQTEGYGRRGHAWVSPRGGMYASVLLRPQVHAQTLATLPLVAGLAVLDACEVVAPDGRFGIKWPNDVYLLEQGHAATSLFSPVASENALGLKVAGISMETYQGAVVVGIGVDAQALPGTPQVMATCRAVLDAFARMYDTWLARGLEPFIDRLNSVDVLLGREVRIENALGELLVQGRAVSIDNLGRLLVTTATGRVDAVSSGEAHISL